jgi:hypothetical protein
MLLRLHLRIKAPSAAQVCATACDVEPVALVAVNVVVDQLALEPRRSCAPVASQVVNQIAGHHLAHAIRQPTCGGELAHACVNQRLAGSAFTPAAKPLLVNLFVVRHSCKLKAAKPLFSIEFFAMLQMQKPEIVAPQQLKPNPIRAVVCAALGFKTLQFCINHG